MANVLALVSFRIYPAHMGGQKGVALFYQYLPLPVWLALSEDNRDTGNPKARRLLYPNKKIYRNLSRLGRLKDLVASNGIDLIIAEHSYTGWIAWLLQRSTHKPYIIHSHNIESRRFHGMHKWWWRLYQWYEGWVHRRAAHNFFISEEDREYAIRMFRLLPSRCSVITYGVEVREQQNNRDCLKKNLGIDPSKTVLLFNGTLDYQPNYDAVVNLIYYIEPILKQMLQSFVIIITGNRAPDDLALLMMKNENVHYTGYVDDVNAYYRAADLFLNPVSNDTGVKTKLIEAIANNCTAVSTVSGASGIRADLCGEKLVIVPDSDWAGFGETVVSLCSKKASVTPRPFYDYYHWEAVTRRAAEKINEIVAT